MITSKESLHGVLPTRLVGQGSPQHVARHERSFHNHALRELLEPFVIL
jgi:hypothetical protein